ncbi:MAG: hypothetical protein QOJ68_2199 [Blastococcus sp.]|jgi:hypothetical protein|nr:hypothetical protein [Blastococcus sp.]
MTSLDDVARVCLALPDTSEVISRGARQWRVHDKLFVWERPLRRRDLEELADAAPTGIVLGARVPDEGAKAALIADDPATFFTTSHFDGYPAVLCRLDVLTQPDLRELAGEAWACRAPRRLLAERPVGPR